MQKYAFSCIYGKITEKFCLIIVDKWEIICNLAVEKENNLTTTDGKA